MRIGITYTFLRKEELMLRDRARRYGDVYMLHEDSIYFPNRLDLDLVIVRNIGFYKALYISRLFEETGATVVNPYRVILEAGDKLYATMRLMDRVEVPRWGVAFTYNGVKSIVEDIGFPVVLKPVIGSWGRLLSRINDYDALEAVIEHKGWLQNPIHRIYFIQEYVEKPGRDIRSHVIGGEYVAAIYRVSDHWITNTSRGGRAEPCDRDDVAEVSLRAWEAFGEGALAFDILEDGDRLLVNEVNPLMEFRNVVRVTGRDIAGKIIEYAVGVARR